MSSVYLNITFPSFEAMERLRLQPECLRSLGCQARGPEDAQSNIREGHAQYPRAYVLAACFKPPHSTLGLRSLSSLYRRILKKRMLFLSLINLLIPFQYLAITHPSRHHRFYCRTSLIAKDRPRRGRGQSLLFGTKSVKVSTG